VTWCAVSVCLALLVLFGLWRPGGVPVAALFSLVLGLAALVDMGWSSVRRQRLGRRARAKPPYAGKGSQRRYRSVLTVPRRLRQPLISVRSGGATCSMRSKSTGLQPRSTRSRGRDHQAPDEVRVPARRFARTSAPSASRRSGRSLTETWGSNKNCMPL